jgi:hypothetical protein
LQAFKSSLKNCWTTIWTKSVCILANHLTSNVQKLYKKTH